MNYSVEPSDPNSNNSVILEENILDTYGFEKNNIDNVKNWLVEYIYYLRVSNETLSSKFEIISSSYENLLYKSFAVSEYFQSEQFKLLDNKTDLKILCYHIIEGVTYSSSNILSFGNTKKKLMKSMYQNFDNYTAEELTGIESLCNDIKSIWNITQNIIRSILNIINLSKLELHQSYTIEDLYGILYYFKKGLLNETDLEIIERPYYYMLLSDEEIRELEYNNIQEDEEMDCSICFELMDSDIDSNIAKLECGHIFHYKCISDWMNQKKMGPNDEHELCPYCRQKIVIKNESELNDTYKTIDKIKGVQIRLSTPHEIIEHKNKQQVNTDFVNNLFKSIYGEDADPLLIKLMMHNYLSNLNYGNGIPLVSLQPYNSSAQTLKSISAQQSSKIIPDFKPKSKPQLPPQPNPQPQSKKLEPIKMKIKDNKHILDDTKSNSKTKKKSKKNKNGCNIM